MEFLHISDLGPTCQGWIRRLTKTPGHTDGSCRKLTYITLGWPTMRHFDIYHASASIASRKISYSEFCTL